MGALRGILATVAVLTAAVTPTQGTYGGGTSQASGGVIFRVSGSQIRIESVWWLGHCRSGKSLADGTSFQGEGITGRRWSLKGAYSFHVLRRNYNANGSVTARVTVIENTGQFTGPISATGRFRASAKLYERGRVIDSCASGLVRWAAGTLASGAPSPLLVQSSQQVGGLTYPQWEAKAWQWEDTYARSRHSLAPTTLPCIRKGQAGAVWFLGHDFYDFGTTFTVTCSVPAGRYVFIDGPGFECSNVERPPYYAKTDAGLESCARSFRPAVSSLAFDGQVISPSGFVVTTRPFSFTMPPTNNALGVPGSTHGRAVYHGQALMLGPLSPGSHALVHVARYVGGPIGMITYKITAF